VSWGERRDEREGGGYIREEGFYGVNHRFCAELVDEKEVFWE